MPLGGRLIAVGWAIDYHLLGDWLPFVERLQGAGCAIVCDWVCDFAVGWTSRRICVVFGWTTDCLWKGDRLPLCGRQIAVGLVAVGWEIEWRLSVRLVVVGFSILPLVGE